MKKHNKSILALLLVISLLAASLCAVPAYAIKPDIIENADLKRTPIEFEFLVDSLAPDTNPGWGVTILNDIEGKDILGRYYIDDVDVEAYSIGCFIVPMSTEFPTVITEVSITTDGDIVVVYTEIIPPDYDELPTDDINDIAMFFAVKKTDIEILNKGSVSYSAYSYGGENTSLFYQKKLRLPIDGYYRFGEPKTEVEFETLYKECNVSNSYFEPYFNDTPSTSLTILNKTESKELLEKINGGELSDGRIDGDHKIDLETQRLGIFVFNVYSYPDSSVDMDIKNLYVSLFGNFYAKIYDSTYFRGEIEHCVIVFAMEKADINRLSKDGKLIIQNSYYTGHKTTKLQLPIEEDEIVLPPHDVNADGAFDAKDLTHLMRVIAGDNTAVAMRSADINGDGAVNVKDLTRMIKLLAVG